MRRPCRAGGRRPASGTCPNEGPPTRSYADRRCRSHAPDWVSCSTTPRAGRCSRRCGTTPRWTSGTGVLWTRASVKALIRLVAGVSMTERGVGKWLRRHGFTPQRPARRSYRHKDDEVSRWLQEEYPAVRARASGEKAELVWADQRGLRSDTAPPGRSWARPGRPAGAGERPPLQGQRHVGRRLPRGAVVHRLPRQVHLTGVPRVPQRLARHAGRKST
ncbi:winged helix-turn-helix domain-containing protein [Streptomyces sioyaensis]|uniref:winged helix-turn-helix domain-containing protein n=1 Tax=Streptomyces sioyaensis TaxID=67364 RepID=UPI00340FED40